MIEDRGISYEKIAAKFGIEVAEGVLALSKNNIIRSEQEQMTDSLTRIKQQPKEVSMVKLSDRITNLQPPSVRWGSEKIAHYSKEAQ